jgi:hypothetical protein
MNMNFCSCKETGSSLENVEFERYINQKFGVVNDRDSIHFALSRNMRFFLNVTEKTRERWNFRHRLIHGHEYCLSVVLSSVDSILR